MSSFFLSRALIIGVGWGHVKEREENESIQVPGMRGYSQTSPLLLTLSNPLTHSVSSSVKRENNNIYLAALLRGLNEVTHVNSLAHAQ